MVLRQTEDERGWVDEREGYAPADGAAVSGQRSAVSGQHEGAVLPEKDAPTEGWVAVVLSFYVCTGAPAGYQDGYCGRMASGDVVYEGAVACGYGWALGTQFEIAGDPTGRVYVCEDRGAGPYWWIDVWFYDYARGRAWRDAVGYGVIEARPKAPAPTGVVE